jgi:hypothetical protein
MFHIRRVISGISCHSNLLFGGLEGVRRPISGCDCNSASKIIMYYKNEISHTDLTGHAAFLARVIKTSVKAPFQSSELTMLQTVRRAEAKAAK